MSKSLTGDKRRDYFQAIIRPGNGLMKFNLEPATANDVAALAALHTAVADHLTDAHGRGPYKCG